METPCLNKVYLFQRDFLESSFMNEIRYVNYYAQETKARTEKQNIRDQLSEIPDVPERAVQTEGMEIRKHSPEHSWALLLSVKQTGFM